jgi:uncharacterized protein YigE (DUF2233 family)
MKGLAVILVLGAAVLFGSALLPSKANVATDDCGDFRFEGSQFTVCSYDPARHDLRMLVTDQTGKPFRRLKNVRRFLGGKSNQVAFAMNAGMFDDAGLPIGLYVEDGNTRFPINLGDASGNFYVKPNGIFWTDATGGHVAETQAYLRRSKLGLSFATQSGPMLAIEGKIHPKFDADGSSRYIRNGVGVGRGGHVRFVISKEPVSLGKFARAFRDHLGCENALFLDGSVSSLWVGSTGRIEQRAAVGPIIVVSRKAL